MQTATAAPGTLDCESSDPPQRPALALVARPALTLTELLDQYFALFTGRDTEKVHRLVVWRERFGDREFSTITDDEIFAALEEIAAQPARIWCGLDADRKPIFRKKGKRTPATVNRYHAALSALFTWAIKNRRAPKGWTNPCHLIQRQREASGVVRFLSDDERARLLEACRASRWPQLYLLVLMAITTGARRGELMALRWGEVDLERALARVCITKNGEPRTLPLVPAVLEELQRCRRGAGSLVFASRRSAGAPFQFEESWREALRVAKVRAFRFHDLRHTFASYLAQNGASLLEIADAMGHRQLAMVKRYAHLTIQSKAALVNRVLGEIK